MNNPSSKTITLFLIGGDPTGVKKIQLSNWSGLAFIIPRSQLAVLNKRSELQKQCLYFLVGGSSMNPEIYIDEAENFQKRISQHQAKDFWNTCIVFLAKDENLSKAHIRYLEAAFVVECRSANRAKMHNGNSPYGAKLSKEDESYMLEFKRDMKLVLSSLGYTFHETASTEEAPNETYFIRSKGLEARGIYTSEGIIVLEGSQIAKEEAPSIHAHLHNLRAEKVQEQMLSDRGDFYVFQQKITFSSLSTAAGFVLGRSANGWTEWKDNNGKAIDEIERKKLGIDALSTSSDLSGSREPAVATE